jgi:hypothetical protein
MKLLFIIQKQQLRGAEIFASQLGSHLLAGGHKVVIVSLYSGEAQLPFTGKFIHLHANPAKRFFDPTSWKLLSGIIKKESPDLVQANAGDTLKYAVFSKLLYRWKQPIVFRNASMISLYIQSWWVKKFNGLFFFSPIRSSQ